MVVFRKLCRTAWSSTTLSRCKWCRSFMVSSQQVAQVQTRNSEHDACL